MDLAFVDGFLTVEQLSTTYLQKSDLAGDLQNLNQYRQCNNTFQQLQVLSASRPECKNVVDTFLFRDAESSLTTVADEVCNSNCFFMVQTALEASMMKCSSVWKEFQFTGKYTDLIYKKLYIAATAHLWSRVSCFKNANEQQCTRTMLDFSELFGACSLFDSGAQKQPRLSAALMMDQPSTRSPVCPAACAEALLEYQVQDGCCSATVSEASAVWAELLSTERDDPKSPFSLDIGETANPWTPLGMGATTRYGVGHDCETSKAIYPQCFMKSSDYCDTPSWIAQCCTFPCYNNGTRGETGECFCSCPYDRVGRNCLRRSTHVRVMFVIPGEDKNSYHAGKRAYTQQALQLLTGALPEDIEWDSVADNAGNVRRRLQQSRETSSVRVVMRILAPVARDALRLSNMVLNGILDQRFADQISNVSKNMWSMEVEMAEYPPIVFDAYGREVCDDIDTTCYLKVRESALQDNVTLVIEEDDGFQGTLTSILGAVAGFLLLALVFFFFCYKEGSVFGNWWQTKTKVNLDGILPRTKDRDNRFYDYRVKQEELVRRTEKMTSTVMFEKARDKPLNYSTRGKKSGEGFVVSDDLWSSLAPSGLSNNLSNTQGIAVSSHLVFDDAMSTSLVPSGAAPTRAGTESAHAKLLIQGKGNQIIESPHVSRNSTRRAAKMVQVRQDKPNPVFFSHFLLNSKQGAAKTPSKLEVADEEDSGEVKESGLTNKGNLLDENPRPEPQPPIIVLPSSRDPLHKVLKNNFEEENSYKYTPGEFVATKIHIVVSFRIICLVSLRSVVAFCYVTWRYRYI